MATLREQTDAQMEKTRRENPEFMKVIDEVMASARHFEDGGHAVAVGQSAPDFELPDARGGRVVLSDLLAEGPVVLTFYRGDWCPYCNLQLRALHSRLNEIRSLGAKLIAISPQVPDGSFSKTDLEELGFPVLSDQDARIAARYGVAWEVPDVILNRMKKKPTRNLARINNGNGTILPIPATFILGRNRIVQWRYVNVDYRQRAEPDDIISALKSYQTSQ